MKPTLISKHLMPLKYYTKAREPIWKNRKKRHCKNKLKKNTDVPVRTWTIMRLPENDIKLILVIVDEIARQHGIIMDTEPLLTNKKKAFEKMLELNPCHSFLL